MRQAARSGREHLRRSHPLHLVLRGRLEDAAKASMSRRNLRPLVVAASVCLALGAGQAYASAGADDPPLPPPPPPPPSSESGSEADAGSTSGYPDASQERAESLFTSGSSTTLDSLAQDPLDLSGEHPEYLDDHTAVIGPDGGADFEDRFAAILSRDQHDLDAARADIGALLDDQASQGEASSQLVSSILPLRTVDDGDKVPVDLSLEQQEGGYVPESPLVDLSLPATLDHEVTVGDQGIGIDVGATDPATADPIGGDNLFYADAATDTDVVLAPLSTGLEALYQLRSPESPDRLEMTFSLPEGASLEPTDDGGAEIAKQGQTLASVSPTTAQDATGQPVPVSASVDGDALELSVPHDDPELAYPITVDPVIADSYNWSAGNTTNMADWTAFNGSNYVPRTSCWGTCATGSGLYVYAPLGSYMPAYNAGGFYYLVPQYPSTTAYISMMAYWLTYSPGSDTNVNPFLAGGIEAPSTNSWLDIKTQTASATNLFWWFNAPSNLATAQTGKAAMFELWSSSTHTMSGWRHAYLGNADVYLSDTDAPQLTNVTHSGVSIAQANWSYSNWVDTEKPGVSVTATDGGLGIQSFQVPNNYGVLTTVPPPSGSCAGTKSSPCPTSSQISLGYDAGLMPNGITITGVVAQDPLAKADSRTWVMRVDHSAPTISLSGGLIPALTDNPYAVHVDATDGNAADTSGAQWQSGVKQIKLYRDGNLVKDTGVQSCTATAGSCPLSLDYDLGSNPPSFPIHFRVEATDQLGHTQVKEWDASLDDASPSHGSAEANAVGLRRRATRPTP